MLVLQLSSGASVVFIGNAGGTDMGRHVFDVVIELASESFAINQLFIPLTGLGFGHNLTNIFRRVFIVKDAFEQFGLKFFGQRCPVGADGFQSFEYQL